MKTIRANKVKGCSTQNYPCNSRLSTLHHSTIQGNKNAQNMKQQLHRKSSLAPLISEHKGAGNIILLLEGIVSLKCRLMHVQMYA